MIHAASERAGSNALPRIMTAIETTGRAASLPFAPAAPRLVQRAFARPRPESVVRVKCARVLHGIDAGHEANARLSTHSGPKPDGCFATICNTLDVKSCRNDVT